LVAGLGLVVGLVGVAVIVWGAYVSAVRLIAAEAAAARGQPARPEAAGGRLLASYLLPGLDFILAGLLIKVAVVPDWQQAVGLASVVVVRTLLGMSWKWEPVAEVERQAPAPVAERPAFLPAAPPAGNGTAEDQALVGVQAGQ
jgi:uncharacterized membrane protein